MSYELSELKFNVNTEKLAEAVKMVGALTTAVADLNKPLKAMGDATKATATDVDKTTQVVNTNTKAVKTNQSILEKQEAILGKMGEGWSKGQASILAAASAAGAANTEMKKLESTLSSQRRLVGGDPFDKSASGLISLTQGLGQVREGYRQLLSYQKEFARLQAEGNGAELRLVGMNRKETDNLYRDKQRMIEQYKLLRVAQFDSSETQMIEKQRNAYKDLKSSLRDVEESYKQVATAKRPLDNIRTVDSTKRRDQLNYMARATSVQLGDIGVSLAGGQNPLTVFLQQGDQLRAILGGVGKDTQAMQQVMSGAFTQIITGFVTVGQAMTALVGGAFKATGDAIVGFTMKWTGFNAGLDLVRLGFEKFDYHLGTNFVKKFDAMGTAMGGFGTILRGLAAVIAGTLVVGLVGLAFAYKEIIQASQDLSVALAMSGGAIAINKNEALKLSAAFASTSGTSMQVAGVITEIAKSGNIGKVSIEGITKASLDLQKFGGVAVKDTVALYAKLADDPVKGLTDLALKTGDVSQATLDHIDALVKQGEGTKAVTEAIAEMDRVNGLAAQKMRADMDPLQALWSEMKSTLTSLKEEFYSLVSSSALVNAFATVWQTVAVIVSEVWFTIKAVGKEIGGIAAQLGAVITGDFAGAKRIGDMMKGDASAARVAQDAYTKSIVDGTSSKVQAEKQYITVIRNGHKERREMTADDKADNIEGIKQGLKFKALAEKFNNVSNMSPAGREKAKASAIAEANALALGSMKAHGADIAAIEKKQAETIANITEQFKPKKEAKGGGANDAFKAEQKALEDARKEAQRNTGMQMDALNSLHKRELINDVDFFNQKFDIEKNSIEKAIGLLEQEQGIASKKKDSLTEVQAFKGKIQAENDKLKDKELERDYALLDLQDKLSKASVKSSMTEIAAIQEKSKAQKLENELIGLTAQQTDVLKTARANSTIAVLAEHVAYMEKHGYSESSSVAYELEKQKLNALREARNLDTEAMSKHTAAERKKLNEVTDEVIRKDTLATQDAQAELNFRESLIGTYGDQKEVMTRAYEAEQAMLQVNRKATEDLIARRKEYNALLTSDPQQNAQTLSDLAAVEAAIGSNAEKQREQIRAGAKIAQKELLDSKLDKFSEGLADALVTGMTKGAKEGRKKLRDLIVAELEKTITLSITANIKSLLTGGGQGGGILDMIVGKGSDGLLSKGVDFLGSMFSGGATAAGVGGSAATTFGAVTSTAGTYGMSGAVGSTTAALAELSTGVAVLGASAAPVVGATAAAGAGLTGMATAALAAIPVVGWVALGIGALFAIFSSGKEKIPTVLNDLAMFNDSLVGLPFLDIALNSDEAAQGLRDVLYGLENASPTMRKLAGETISLSVELMRASGDIAGARNLARNLGTRGMSEKEIGLYDENEKIRDQIEAYRNSAAAANEGAAAANALEQAEKQLATERWNLTGRLNILLGRTTQLEFDRATALAATTDEASLGMLQLIHTLEDLSSTVDRQFATLERSIAAQEKVIAAERKLVEVRLASSTALQSALKSAKDATTLIMGRDKAQQGFSQLLALAKATGVLPSLGTLQPLLDSLTVSSEDLFGTFEDYQRDFLRTAYDIKEMSILADDQVSIEQAALGKLDAQVEFMRLQLETAKAQLDALRGVDTSVNNVAKAIEDFDNAMRAMAGATSSAATYAASAPTPTSASSTGGGGYGGGYSAPAASAAEFESIAGQDNKDIVAAYRAYYNRNPDSSGYKYFLGSSLTGDKLMQAILGASAGNPDGGDFKTAISRGYNPLDPIAKFLKSTATAAASTYMEDFGSFAIGSNYIPNDQIAQIHKGERILPAADNRELFERLQSPDDNAQVLSQALRELREEVMQLRKSSDKGNENTKRTADTLQGQQGVPFLVEIAK